MSISLLEIIFLGVGLSMDACAVAMCIGAAWPELERRAGWRVAYHFGFFQFLMPVLGWSLGLRLVQAIQAIDHWVAFLLLVFVGARMLSSGLRGGETCFCRDPTRGGMLLLLSLATSIDALAVGLSLALLQVEIWFASVMIGLITCTFSLFCIKIGKAAGATCGRRMEVVGGAILLLIGVRILVQHLRAG